YPIYTARAQGSHVWDVDGNEYVDYILGLGPMLLGHNHHGVTGRIQEQLSTYVLNSTPTLVEVELAERLIKIIPCGEKVRFTTSGTEANMLAVRLARSFTGRDILLRVRDDYVGWADSLMPGIHIPAHQVGAGRAWGLGGVPEAVRELTLWFDFNDTEGFKELVEKVGPDRIAGVIMEPAYRASIAPQPGFLETIRSVTQQIGAILMYDEVVTGFRYGLTGGQGYFGVTPDLASFGKAISAGLPFGILTGRRDLMDRMSTQHPPEERVYHSGTWCGQPLECAAAMAVLDVLEEPTSYPFLLKMGERMRSEIQEVINSHEVPMTVFGIGPVLEMAFTDEPVVSPKNYKMKVEPQVIKDMWLAMALDGVLTVGKGYIPALRCFLSLAHTEQDIQKAKQSVDRAIGKVFGR
ncbi:MAG: aminotransferase class III-fold pyridoxal phosphate-dependent enzyme, partial [Dehalococcoidia bacterium]|nr:aminotransferase class III-fold pyridoxal phosphate-dependent enzyme [Dehalococcoidia bacterium]